MSSPKFRPMKFGVTRVTLRDGDSGALFGCGLGFTSGFQLGAD